MNNSGLQSLKTQLDVPVVGVKKQQTGGLIVDDSQAFNKYKREKQLMQRIAKLEEQVSFLLAIHESTKQ